MAFAAREVIRKGMDLAAKELEVGADRTWSSPTAATA